MLAERPATVAVELPSFLEEMYYRALDRLPELSVILYSDLGNDDDHTIYVPVEPCDPFIEAIRTAQEIEAKVVFLEPDSAERPHLHDAYPDPYAVNRIGLDRYIESYRVWPQQRNEEITEHAAAMAWKLQGADPDSKTIAVISLNLLDPLLDAMEDTQDGDSTVAAGIVSRVAAQTEVLPWRPEVGPTN